MYPIPDKLDWPVANYTTGDYYRFGDRIRRYGFLWRQHLGDDVAVSAGTAVKAIGKGRVVLAQTYPGSVDHKTWGGVVIVGHQFGDGNERNKNSKRSEHSSELFFSIYGHMTDVAVTVDEEVSLGQRLGQVAAANTSDNGWWRNEHLHFAMYIGPWQGEILPGWFRVERWWRTKLRWWVDPQAVIKKYS